MSHAYALLRRHGRPTRPRLGGRFAAHASEVAAPTPAPAEVEPALRPGVAQRCAELGVRLTEKRRRLIEVFDTVAAPIDLDEVWWKAVELQLDVNRSSLHRLAANLVAAGVLHEIGLGDRRTRYATPLSASVEIAASPDEDPTLAEMLVEALARRGVDAANRRIVITVLD